MGIRIDALSATAIPTLAHEFPAMADGLTVKLTLAQIGEVLGIDGLLQAVANLSDLEDPDDALANLGMSADAIAVVKAADAAAMRTALGLGTAATASAAELAPPGKRGEFYRSTAPTGWLKANGAVVDRTVYADLDAAIYCGDANNAAAAWGYRTNSSDTVRSTTGTHVKLPESRGEFSRGWDDGRGIDSGRSLWATQADEFKSHNHTLGNQGIGDAGVNHASVTSASQGRVPLNPTGLAGGTETRPRNIAALVCIKY